MSSPDHHDEGSRLLNESLARRETRAVNCHRAVVLLVMLVTALVVAGGVYIVSHAYEQDDFHWGFGDDAQQILNSFGDHLVDRKLASVASMSTSLTILAQQTNQTFPRVTFPNFDLLGSHLRVTSGSHVVRFMPVVTDEQREEWETYAMEHRAQIDESTARDEQYRIKQDAEFGIHVEQPNGKEDGNRNLEMSEGQEQLKPKLNMTILADGTGYHPKIWRNPSVLDPGDEPHGEGPYVPEWQISPGTKQSSLNMNFAHTQVFTTADLKNMINDHKAIFGQALVPIPQQQKRLEGILKASQYRQRVGELVDGLSTFLIYPVFDSLDQKTRQVAGVVATTINWKILFSNLLTPTSRGIFCVVENSYSQEFTYRIDGQEATFLGMGDLHDPAFDHLEFFADIGKYIEELRGPENSAYDSVPLNDQAQYSLRVYPSQETENPYITSRPVYYTLVLLLVLLFAVVVFMLFSYAVEKRQKIMTTKVVENGRRATAAERELNEFLSHEVRNPLSAAMSAATFVEAALNEPEPLPDEETKKVIREDISVITASLHFINDFLRSMLDINRSINNQIKIDMSPTDMSRDVLRPVSVILYTRGMDFDVLVECPDDLIVMTDAIRLKQVVMNLARNASKFVEKGFVRMKVGIDLNQKVRLFIEDSGPGVPLEKRDQLFKRYQASLDLLSQGTGIGLSLSKQLMVNMNGNVWFDESYDSGIEGCPGSRFVIELNQSPVDIEAALDMDESQIGTLDERNCTDSTGHDSLRSEEQHFVPLVLPTGKSVLFVDDNAVLRKMFVRALKKVDPSWTIQEAASGETALEACESEHFDLVFLDQYMASTNKQLLGTETAQAMRRKGIGSVICGLSANDIRNSFMDSGANDFVLKPIPCKEEDLRQMLIRILSS